MASVFVVIPSNSRYGIVFGKNSNRSAGEVQELILEPKNDVEDGEVQCSNISVPAAKNHSVILSRPVGLWGCEMGANENGVAGGMVQSNCKAEGFIGQDILRLALERSATAEEAVHTIGPLLKDFGTDGVGASLLIADRQEAWQVEIAGKAWVAQKISSGVRILPGSHRIADDYDLAAENLDDLAKAAGWSGDGKISWKNVFGKENGDEKQNDIVNSIISSHFNELNDFNVQQMTKVLRDVKNRISRPASDATPTAASQISVLPKSGPCCHWFTATPDPTLSVFKPFVFTPAARISSLTKCISNDEPQHQLYKLHASATASGENKVISLLQEMEANCLNEMDSFLFDPGQALSEVDDLLKDCVEAEVKFYK